MNVDELLSKVITLREEVENENAKQDKTKEQISSAQFDNVIKNLNRKIDQLKKKIASILEKEAQNKLQRIFRLGFSFIVATLFIGLNIFIASIVFTAFRFDIDMLQNINADELKSYDRLIDQKVLIALITAIFAETAVSFGLLVRYVFKVKNTATTNEK